MYLEGLVDDMQKRAQAYEDVSQSEPSDIGAPLHVAQQPAPDPLAQAAQFGVTVRKVG